jgi:hypothetical protein
LPTFLLFIDYEKAFDRVDRNKLWAILHNKGYPQHLINTIKVLYNNSNFCLPIEGKNTDRKEITNQGLKQGCSISPILFNIYRVSRKEMQRLHHLILGAILSKTCYINMGLIRNGYRDMQVSAFG